MDGIIKEVAIQNNKHNVAEIDDDVEKMFDRSFLELQLVLLLLAGAGIQGFTKWQCANMYKWTNKLITDIFFATRERVFCGDCKLICDVLASMVEYGPY